MDTVLEKELALLSDQGELYPLTNGLLSKPKIVDMQGNPVPFEEWMGHVKGARVEDLDGYGFGSYRFTRTEGPIVVPELKLLEMTSDFPPLRTYQWVGRVAKPPTGGT